MKNKLLKIILCLICACVLTGCDVIKTVDNNIKGSSVYNINFNDRMSGKLYVVHGCGGLTIITDNQTGREYMYYDKTVVELKTKEE